VKFPGREAEGEKLPGGLNLPEFFHPDGTRKSLTKISICCYLKKEK
jgi:hypothetical protein